MTPPPKAVIEVLNDLLDAELNSVFHVLADNAPYLDRASGQIRQPLAEIEASSGRRADELAALIDQLGGTVIPRGLQAEEQYLPYLSLQFLLPKLIGAKKLAVQRWAAALAVVSGRSSRAKYLLERQWNEHEHQLLALERAARSIQKKTPRESIK